MSAIDGAFVQCRHVWRPRLTAGGDPHFSVNRHMSHEPIVYVTCSACGDRTWFTKTQWGALPTARKA